MRQYGEVLLDPEQSVLIIIDHQPQMYFGIEGKCRSEIENNVIALAKAAKLFNVPCILTTIEAESFSGFIYSKIKEVYPDIKPVDRTAINMWEDANLKKTVENTKRKKAILAGLWTEACVAFPALCMKSDGYDIYVSADACGGMSKETHNTAIQRMIQAGIKPVTSMQVILEWQRDWSNKDTYDGLMQIIKDHGSAYGLGVEYAESMLKKN